MASEDGWRPIQKPSRPVDVALQASPFSRLALTHALSVAGDTLLTMALAGSLFFSISPSAARGRVALYLALTMAPFAVVAPFLGPVLDRSRGGRRLMVVGSCGGRAVLCALMAGDVKSLLLFPEAFVFLVLSKAYSITKSALVPAAVESQEELVEANSKLQLLAVAAGVVIALPGGLLLKFADARWVLRLATVVFGLATVAALRLNRASEVAPPPAKDERAELRNAGIVLAASAMGLLRGIVGFLTFLIAFNFRHGDAPSWWFGVVLAASMGGTLIGAAVAPRVREAVHEERILLWSLVLVAIVGLVAARSSDVRVWAAALAGTVAVAASAGKLAFDSLVQRDAPDAARGRSFARFETRFQLIWVVGAFIPVVVTPLNSHARVGFVVVAVTAGFAAASFVVGTRASHRRSAAAAK